MHDYKTFLIFIINIIFEIRLFFFIKSNQLQVMLSIIKICNIFLQDTTTTTDIVKGLQMDAKQEKNAKVNL